MTKTKIDFNGKEYILLGKSKYYFHCYKNEKGEKKLKGLHVAVWEYHNNRFVPKGYHIHHKDGNTFNNNIDNLECLSADEHNKIPKNYDREKQLKHLETIRYKAKEWHKSEEGKAWHKSHYDESLGKIEMKDFKCEQCGKNFKSKYYNPRFCSHNCSVKWDYRNKTKYIEKKCIICGNKFNAKITPRHKEGGETCSRSCRGKLINKNRKKNKEAEHG